MTQSREIRNAPAMIGEAGSASPAAWAAFVKRTARRPKAQERYCQDAARFIDWLAVRRVDLGQATAEQVEAFLDEQQLPYKSRSICQMAIRQLYDALRDHGVVAENPAARQERPIVRLRVSRGGQTLMRLQWKVGVLAPELSRDSKEFSAALVLLAAQAIGSGSVREISRLTRIQPQRVGKFAKRLRASGLWTEDGRTTYRWKADGRDDRFLLDVYVALGIMT